jgi:hypothetical protein
VRIRFGCGLDSRIYGIDDIFIHQTFWLCTVRFISYHSSKVKGYIGHSAGYKVVRGDFQNVSNDYANHGRSMLLMKVHVITAPLSQLEFMLLRLRYSSSPRIFWCSTYLIFSQQCFALQKLYICRGPWGWHGWAQNTWHSVSSRSNL